MKKTFFTILLIGSVLAFTGCALNKMVKMAKDQQLTVEPSPLEVHADTVKFKMSAALPTKMLKKGKVYTVNTYYEYGEQELALEGIEFKADDYPNSSTQQPSKSENFSFAYDPAMRRGDLTIEGVASDPRNDKSKTTDRLPVAEGLITTSTLVKDVYFAAFADHGYNNEEELIPTHVDFFFDQGSSVLRSSERRSDRADSLNAFIAAKNVTRTVTITGAHSPEGLERINSRLAEDRAKVIEDYYRKMMKKYDYQGMADSIKFVLKPVIEDWGGFSKALKDFDGVTEEEKTNMLNVVNGPGEFEEKEKKLRSMPGYKKVFKEVYPGLRTAKTEILSVKEKKTDAEIAILAKMITEDKVSADTLSDEELSYAATLTPSIDEQEAIYEAATKKNDSWASHNNLGAVYVQKAIDASGDADRNKYAGMAVTQLELANKKQESSQAYINLASVYVMQGNLGKAMESISKAESLGATGENAKGLNSVKGALLIHRASYGDALRSLANAEETADNLFNKGLAQILTKDYENALTTLGEATNMNPDHALAFYAAAVAAARTQKEDQVYKNLASATSKDSGLKEYALKDLEFKAYETSEDFQDALK